MDHAVQRMKTKLGQLKYISSSLPKSFSSLAFLFFLGGSGGGGRKDVGVGHVSVPSYTEDTYTNTFHELELQYMESTEM